MCAHPAHRVTSHFSIYNQYCSKNMIVYKELSSIVRELGFTADTLYGVSNNIGGHYRSVSIPKRNGGVRELSVPDEILKKIQRQILHKLLAYESVSRYATGYKIGSGVKRNAQRHVRSNKILKLDIKDFFGSILYSAVKEKVFPEDKYSEQIRVLLAMLCYHKDSLPQGAPTSPAISNIIMREFDEEVGDWCRDRHITYSRYCDDMTFSGSGFDSFEVKNFVSDKLRKMNLYLNEKKSAEVTSDKRQTVTGVVVNEKTNAPAEYKRKIRQEIYFCKKFGVEEHLKRMGSEKARENYLQGLLGRISFVLQLCLDKEFVEYKKYVIELMKNK